MPAQQGVRGTYLESLEAAMVIATPRWTYERLLERPDDGKRFEIIDGELVELPSPTFEHQTVSDELTSLLRFHLRVNRLGVALSAPYDVVLPSGDSLQPDVMVFLRPPGRRHEARRRGEVSDLMVEVLSPSTQDRDLGRKLELYAEFGVKEYWPVDWQTRTIRVLVLRDGRYEEAPQEPGIVRSVVVPRLEIVLDDLFAVLDEVDDEIANPIEGS
jgi:Uma2 family endonuclease